MIVIQLFALISLIVSQINLLSSSKDLRVTPLTTPAPKKPIVSSLADFDIPL